MVNSIIDITPDDFLNGADGSDGIFTSIIGTGNASSESCASSKENIYVIKTQFYRCISNQNLTLSSIEKCH